MSESTLDPALVNLLRLLVGATLSLRKENLVNKLFDSTWAQKILRSATKAIKTQPSLTPVMQPLFDSLKRPNTCGKKGLNKEVKHSSNPQPHTQIDVQMVMKAENSGNTPDTLRDLYKETMTTQLYEEKIKSDRLPPKNSSSSSRLNRSRMSISSKQEFQSAPAEGGTKPDLITDHFGSTGDEILEFENLSQDQIVTTISKQPATQKKPAIIQKPKKISSKEEPQSQSKSLMMMQSPKVRTSVKSKKGRRRDDSGDSMSPGDINPYGLHSSLLRLSRPGSPSDLLPKQRIVHASQQKSRFEQLRKSVDSREVRVQRQLLYRRFPLARQSLNGGDPKNQEYLTAASKHATLQFTAVAPATSEEVSRQLSMNRDLVPSQSESKTAHELKRESQRETFLAQQSASLMRAINKIDKAQNTKLPTTRGSTVRKHSVDV